ncbi:MAG: hypothetical protein KIG85_05570 [Thiopseudomonas sp.]|nr:hypothetical protein [Thiopseudomonas sp.]
MSYGLLITLHLLAAVAFAGTVFFEVVLLANVMLPLFCGVLSSLLTRLFCAVPRTSVARIAWG